MMKNVFAMKHMQRMIVGALLLLAVLSMAMVSKNAKAESAEEIRAKASRSLQTLYRTNPTAHNISRHAKAVLVFPSIVKAGLIFGGAYGEGALYKGGKVVSYYNSVTASWGLQAGAESCCRISDERQGGALS